MTAESAGSADETVDREKIDQNEFRSGNRCKRNGPTLSRTIER
jgi:hypothetical protein